MLAATMYSSTCNQSPGSPIHYHQPIQAANNSNGSPNNLHLIWDFDSYCSWGGLDIVAKKTGLFRQPLASDKRKNPRILKFRNLLPPSTDLLPDKTAETVCDRLFHLLHQSLKKTPLQSFWRMILLRSPIRWHNLLERSKEDRGQQ